MMCNVVLQQAMHRYHILTEEFDVLSDVTLGNVAVMRNNLHREVLRSHARSALTNALCFIKPQMAMKRCKHLTDLLKELFSRRRIAEPIKENGIAFHFGYLQPDIIRLDQLFQKLFDDVLAVRNLGGLN